MRRRILWDKRHMRTSEHYSGSPLAETVRELVCPAGSAGNYRQADQVRLQIKRNLSNALIKQLNIDWQLRRNQRRECRQCERLISQRLLPDAAAMAVQRALRRNKC